MLKTRNQDWGFYGSSAGFTDADVAWGKAFERISKATGAADAGVREFLDSRHGRHFADDVHSGIFAGMPISAAIDAAVTRWMGWTISRATSRETGIPKGLPYLTGLVAHFEILAEVAA
jgi:hypothetical protein